MVSDGITLSALESQEITLLNWNLQKQLDSNWQSDLSVLGQDINLGLFQEADLNTDIQSIINHAASETFTQGYQNTKQKTGVMTYATALPQRHESLLSLEPWLRTPKATNVTIYPLSGLEESLLVVNIHAINFSIGLSSYHIQMQKIVALINEHCGPVILAGDFNTWHLKRLNLIKALVWSLELDEVMFNEDKRKMFWGLPLDHIFTRGLNILHTQTYHVKTSDHNPMLATFSVKI